MKPIRRSTGCVTLSAISNRPRAPCNTGRIIMLEAMNLSDLLKPLDATLNGSDARFDSVSIDARQVQPGGLFVALPGSRVDGHDFVAQARAAGAAAALVERPLADPLPQLVVRDCELALGQLGALNRAAFKGPLV